HRAAHHPQRKRPRGVFTRLGPGTGPARATALRPSQGVVYPERGASVGLDHETSQGGTHIMTLVIAHRGNSSVAPENTLPAFASAGFAGADMIEIDVQVGGDGAGVIMHDDYVDRTTDAAGPVS